ncbi:MAG: protoglobin domain-containing protein [Polyangiales bacterium]
MQRASMAPGEEHLFDEMKRYVGFSPRDEANLKRVGPRVAPHAHSITDEFYARVLQHDGARAAITGGDAQVDSLKCTLVSWLHELFTGPWDLAYYERRARIGRRHVSIDLPQRYMFTAMSLIRSHVCRIVATTAASPEEAHQEVNSVDRVIDLELAVMLHTYQENSLSRLQQSERLATFGQFAASIAHELRNPLGVIESSSFLLRKRICDPSDTASRHLNKIDAQVQLSNRIITSLLDLVRERPLVPRELLAKELITASIDAIPSCAATVRTELSDERLTVCADFDQARQILTNLLSNACEAAGAGGEILLAARSEGAEAIFLVNDSGPGIDPSIRRRIFEPLVTTKVRGIGLGLALCRRLAERNGGTITVVSGPLSGAAFELRLPSTAKR